MALPPSAVNGTKFLNIDTEGGNNNVTVKPYADNTIASWGIATNVTSSTAGSQNTLNYGNITPYLIDDKPPEELPESVRILRLRPRPSPTRCRAMARSPFLTWQ